MSNKRTLVIAVVAISALLLTLFLIATAPASNCFIGLILYNKWSIIDYESSTILIYNWTLGIIAFVMTIVMIIMFKSKSLKRYAKLLTPWLCAITVCQFSINSRLKETRNKLLHKWIVNLYVVLLILWWILRNTLFLM